MSYGVSQPNKSASVNVNELKVQNICQTSQTGPSVNFRRLLLNCIFDTMNLFLNSMRFERLQKLRVKLGP